MGAELRAWIGAVALLFYSALPLAHNALAALPAAGGSSGGAQVFELCTADGLRVITIPPGKTGGESDRPLRPWSCPICQILQHAAMALPPTGAVLAVPLATARFAPPNAITAPPRRLTLALAQPRAPPVA